MDPIYLDHAATTPPDPDVLEAMYPYLTDHYGNAHSPHQRGRTANGAVESARETIANVIGCELHEIIFTSGGTESNNAIIKGIAHSLDGGEIITSKAEHHAVLNTVEYCRNLGYKPVYLKPDSEGRIHPGQVEDAINEDTAFVTLMHINNELGSINPIESIGALCHEYDLPFHTDAVQSMGKIPIDVDQMQVDFLSASGHKLHAPKGIGFMYVRDKSRWSPWMHGGSQENNRRAGTLNVPGIVALGAAVKKCREQRQVYVRHIQQLHDHFMEGLQQRLSDRYRIHGPASDGKRVPHIINLSFLDQEGNPADGEMFLMNLDMEGICASSGSACASGAVEPSHVLQSIGLSREQAQSGVRFSLGKDNDADQIDQTLDAIENILERIT